MQPTMSAIQAGTAKRFRTDVHKQEAPVLEEGWVDSTNTLNMSGAANPTYICISDPVDGTGPTMRIGNRIRVTRVEWRCYFSKTGTNLFGYAEPSTFRVLIYIDKQQNGGLLSGVATQLLNNALNNGTADVDALWNPHTVPSRYNIIFDHVYVAPPIRGTASGIGYGGSSYDFVPPGGALVGYTDYSILMDRWLNHERADIKLDLITDFSALSSNPQTNGVNICIIPGGSVDAYAITYMARCTFENFID